MAVAPKLTVTGTKEFKEVCKRALEAEARAEKADGELARLRISRGDGFGWTLDYDFLKRVNDKACESGWQCSMESVEATILAMAEFGYALLDAKGDGE